MVTPPSRATPIYVRLGEPRIKKGATRLEDRSLEDLQHRPFEGIAVRGAYIVVGRLMGMPSGRVKFFNSDRGYGFISPDGGGPDVFVHISRGRDRGHENISERPTAHIQHRCRSRWPLKGRQSSLA